MISALSLGEEAGDTEISLQPGGGEGRGGVERGGPGLSPTAYRLPATAVDFQEAFSPWLAGPLGWGRAARRQGCPHLLQAGPRAAQGGGLFPRGAWARKHKWPLCVLSRVWAAAFVTAGPQWRAGCELPHPSLDPSPASAGGRDGRQRAQTALVPYACRLPRAPCPLGPPLAFPHPPSLHDALTSDHRGPGHHCPTLCREGN